MDDENEGKALAALMELHVWGEEWKELMDRRKEAVGQAWRGGCTNVALIARTLGVSRDTVYADLVSMGIDYRKRRWEKALVENEENTP